MTARASVRRGRGHLAGPAVGAVVVALVAAASAPAAAQSWRTLGVARQLHDSAAVKVDVEYGAGRMTLGAASVPLLYDMRLRYDADRAEPLHAYSADTRALRVGVRKPEVRFRGDGEGAELRLNLTDAAPLDLSLDLGAVEAELDLSRLRVNALDLECGAADATLRFDAPNPERMRSLSLDVGAASLTALRLANANAGDVRVDAGAGLVDLDFSGAWTQDVTLTVDVTLGAVRVHVPGDVGVRVDVDKVLGSFEHDGLVKRAGSYFSDNWDGAHYKLHVRADATLGKLELDRR
jgi:hypothetical protein